MHAANEEAIQEKTNRGAFIQTALEKYLETKRRLRTEPEKRNTMEDAARKMDALAKKLGNWDPQSTIRKFRGTNLIG